MKLTPERIRKIERYLEGEGMRAADLARRLGVNASNVSRWLRGQVKWLTAPQAAKLCRLIPDLDKGYPLDAEDAENLSPLARDIAEKFDSLPPDTQIRIANQINEEATPYRTRKKKDD